MTGRRFGPYELEELLGRGGMGEVWRAVDTRKSRTVALKLLPSDLAGDADTQERFRREAQVAARLSDPHVIPIHDYGALHGRLFLDMRLVQGQDLARTLQETGAMPPARAVSIVAQVADALDAAHDDGLVHRDVKPSNILLTTPRSGSGDFVYLIDFGIAAGSMLGTRLTMTGHAVGTAAYMAPERFTENRDADRRVDVYALGCVLHEMLTGSAPFDGTSFPNLMYQHLNAPPPRPSAHGELPSRFDQVVSTALAKDPDRRYARAGDLAAAAREALHVPRAAPVDRRAPTPPAGPPPGPRRQSAVPTMTAPPRPPAPGTHHPRPAASAPAAPGGRGPWWLVSAVAAIVLHGLWGLITVGGTAVTFSHCGDRSLSCVGGVVGLVAIGTGVVGVLAAIAVIRSRSVGRNTAITWIALGAAFILLMATALFDGAASTA